MRPLLLPVKVAGREVPTQPHLRQVAVTVSLMPDTVGTVLRAPDDGWRYHTKHVQQLTD
jgi:hypothetical protein